MSFPIKLIAVAPGMSAKRGDFAILEGTNGSLRKVLRTTPDRKLKAMLRCHGITADDPRADAFVAMCRVGQPIATF